MKTKRKSTRRTRKQRGGSDEVIVDMLHTIMITEPIKEFRTLAQTFYQKNKSKFTRDKWISILKQLFQKNGIKLEFQDVRDVAVSSAVLSYYETVSRCPGPGCVDPEPDSRYPLALPRDVYKMYPAVTSAFHKKQMSPVQRLEGYLETAYEHLVKIVEDKIRKSEILLFSDIRVELLKKTKGIRPGNADFVTNIRQWIYLLIRLRNSDIEIILDDPLPQEIATEVKHYYDVSVHDKKIRKREESTSRERALRMEPDAKFGMADHDSYRNGVSASEFAKHQNPIDDTRKQYFFDQGNPPNR